MCNSATCDIILNLGLFFLENCVINSFVVLQKFTEEELVMKKLSVLLMMSMLSCGLLFAGCGDKENEETTTGVETDVDVEDEDDEDDADVEEDMQMLRTKKSPRQVM